MSIRSLRFTHRHRIARDRREYAIDGHQPVSGSKPQENSGRPPSFPPGVRDAPLLGGTVLDLLAREEGPPAAARLASRLHPGGSRAALVKAFGGRDLRHTEKSWRAHLARLGA